MYPTEGDSSITILLVANKYSPNNFWYVTYLRFLLTQKSPILTSCRNGRYRAVYHVSPASSASSITGTIHVDVHYYEDGNVSLNNKKPLSLSLPSSTADSIIKRIANAERDHQDELNQAFSRLAEGAFKGLRRQLPITRQKVEWEKVGGYRLGQDISGSRAQ